MLDQPLAPVALDIPASVQQFCAIAEPYAPDAEYDDLFVTAMRDITALHISRSPWYQRFAQHNGIDPTKLKTMADIIAIPPVHAAFFKHHEIRSIHESQIKIHLTSSGTSGQKSQIFFDDFTRRVSVEMVEKVFKARGIKSDQPVNYLLNGFEPYQSFKVGTSQTLLLLMDYAPKKEHFWSLRHIGANQHEFDIFGAEATLERWAASPYPTRILGFPAFIHFILERRRLGGKPNLKLPPGSLVFFLGGWKGHADKAVPKAELHASLTEQLGIASDLILESFGAVEHSIPYLSCAKQHLHQPSWSRVIIRDVKTLQPVPDGTPGFLSFLSPYITAAPAHSVVMGDMAVRHPAASCPLSTYPTPWFEVLGRAGTSTNRSCAVAAAELLKTI
jgi:hypothetical protein